MAGRRAAAGVIRTRFAPSPTGPLHLGHAFAALTAARLADPSQFLLRIEDIDRTRCRPRSNAGIKSSYRVRISHNQVPAFIL